MSEGSNTSKQQKKKTELFIRYWSFIRPYRFILLLIIILGLIQLAAPLTVPWITGVLIDEVLDSEASEPSNWTLKKAVLLMAGAFLLSTIVRFIRNLVTAHLGSTMVVDIRQKIYAHLQKLSPKFYENRPVGGIVSRVLNDVNGAQNLVGNAVINVIIDLFVVFFASFILFLIDWRLALLALWILPVYYLSFTNMNVRIRFAWRSVHRQMERISAVLVERISGMKIVQSFNQEKSEMDRFHKQSKFFYSYAMFAHLLSNILGSITQTFNQFGTVIIWFVGGVFVLNGELKIGALVAFQGYLSQMYGPIQRFSEVNITVQNSMANVERIFEVFDYEVDIQNETKAIPLPKTNGEIVFENVNFTYVAERPDTPKHLQGKDPDVVEKFKPDKKFYLIPPRTKPGPPPIIVEQFEALKNINFHAKPGQVVALVGASGAGKSTLINLIPRFYDPNEGRVLLDGIDLKDYVVEDVRQHISMVLQDNILFSGTVRENIAYGNPAATLEDVVAAAKAANAHQFISEWENSYDMILGERGMRLSGGQKQRVAIARALLRNPKILILDEATSALDAESEELVTEALEKLMENRTTFVIAHRLATVVRADQILVMDQGTIAEHGTHEELLRAGGIYRSLYEKQLKAMRPEELEKAKLLIGS